MTYRINEEGALVRGGFEYLTQEDGSPWTDEAASAFVASLEALEASATPPEVITVEQPVRISRIDFRRLLKPKEALWFDAAEAEPPLSAQELDEAFDANTATPELQLKAAKRDAILQWRLLDDVIELNHDDTRDFLFVMGYDGMFGADASTRIPRILSGEPPE